MNLQSYFEIIVNHGPRLPDGAMASRELAAVGDEHGLGRLPGLRADTLYLLHNVHALGDRSEDNVLAIKPGRLHGAEEELRAIGVRAGVRHGEDAGTSVFEGEVLV